MINVEPTANIRMAETFEVWIRVPVSYAMGISGTESSFQSVQELQYTEQEEMPGFSPLGYGIQAGVRIRLVKK